MADSFAEGAAVGAVERLGPPEATSPGTEVVGGMVVVGVAGAGAVAAAGVAGPPVASNDAAGTLGPDAEHAATRQAASAARIGRLVR